MRHLVVSVVLFTIGVAWAVHTVLRMALPSAPFTAGEISRAINLPQVSFYQWSPCYGRTVVFIQETQVRLWPEGMSRSFGRLKVVAFKSEAKREVKP